MEKGLIAYSLGRIYNKYLILDLFYYAFDFEDIVPYITSISQKYRLVMIRNYSAFMNNYPKQLLMRSITRSLLSLADKSSNFDENL